MSRTSTRIITIYFLTGISWILASDWLFTLLNYPEHPIYQTIKGCAFIIVSGLAFLYMLRKYEQRNTHYLKQLEELNTKLKSRAEELAASNLELEQFAYVASHDLQEPLRMITGFLNLLEKKYGTQLDTQAREYIYFAVDGATRMRQIISDLLEYSKMGIKDFPKENFAVTALLEEIKSLNQSVLNKTDVLISTGDLPQITGGRILLLQVFQNLILNAVKYRKPGKQALIEIKHKDSGAFWEFSVADNGIGIGRDSLDKIFVLFQRLHPREKFSGNGIGLAICKKIIENHGGQIWATSEEGKGSTFYFSIKK